MRTIHCELPHPANGQEDRVARLVRHLEARLLDFGPGGPEVLEADQLRGFVSARFPGHDTSDVLAKLAQNGGVFAALENDLAVFHLSPQVLFEDLDYVWGCLFDLL